MPSWYGNTSWSLLPWPTQTPKSEEPSSPSDFAEVIGQPSTLGDARKILARHKIRNVLLSRGWKRDRLTSPVPKAVLAQLRSAQLERLGKRWGEKPIHGGIPEAAPDARNGRHAVQPVANKGAPNGRHGSSRHGGAGPSHSGQKVSGGSSGREGQRGL